MAKLKESHKKELTELNSKIDLVANSKNKEYESAIRRVNNERTLAHKNTYLAPFVNLPRDIQKYIFK
jgi:hypothetical protein